MYVCVWCAYNLLMIHVLGFKLEGCVNYGLNPLLIKYL